MTQTSKSEVVPELAESLRQIDSLTYEAKLRKGVRFHSGDEMTAEDVKFTFDRLTRQKRWAVKPVRGRDCWDRSRAPRSSTPTRFVSS